jgi:YidC/Oxa1 family membrane protein insertase
MERGSNTKWLLLGLAIFFLVFQVMGKKGPFSSGTGERQPKIEDELTPAGPNRPAEELCTIESPRFRAVISSYGASLRHLYLKDPQYTRPSPMGGDLLASVKHLLVGDAKGSEEPADLVTTSRPGRSPLRTDLRAPGADDKVQQVAFDDLDWKLDAKDGASCTFSYVDAQTSLRKVLSLGKEPFELAVDVTLQNLAPEARKHRFSIEQTAYRTTKEMEGHLGRQSELVTDDLLVTAQKTERLDVGDFKPGNFSKPEFTSEKWRRGVGAGRLAAVSTVYFTELLIPDEGPAPPSVEALAEEVWNWQKYGDANKDADPAHGYVFRARLAYPDRELATNETIHYRATSFTGPKERDLLAKVSPSATEVLNLGTFATIARYLVKYLYLLHDVVRSWGWAIVLLTITVRLVLFPLSLSQIKNSMAMRKLKPEMDALNEKYKDDAAQKGLAIQELWRKNGVSNPVVGCAPMLLQMPVWWALYTALQTAVELYHVPFGPVIPDLSAPGRYLIIPLVLGASSFFQQRLMPAQGDPAQQRMMMFLMPSIFTFMMLFLPAGLGVYMLTNSLLAIAQQLLVERYLKKGGGGGAGQIEVREKTSDAASSAPALGKGKARVRG